MRPSRFPCFLFLFLPCLCHGEEAAPQPHLSRAEADEIVAEEMLLRAERERQLRESIRSVPDQGVWSSRAGGKRTILRRVAPQPVNARPVPVPSSGGGNTVPFEREGKPEHRNLHISATVFDRKITELVWRKDGFVFTALSNVDFNHLTSPGGFEHQGIHWSVFFGMENICSESERKRARLAARHGIEILPRTIPDDGVFTSEAPEYVIFAENANEVPEEMIEELDALHRYYAANEARLKAGWQRVQVLNEARKAWHEANPPAAGDTVTNFWPVKSRTQGK